MIQPRYYTKNVTKKLKIKKYQNVRCSLLTNSKMTPATRAPGHTPDLTHACHAALRVTFQVGGRLGGEG